MKRGSGKGIGRKAIIGGLLLVLMIAVIVFGCSRLKGNSSIDFALIEPEDLPTQLTEEIMPEYQLLERALACIVDGKVYVAATRGEKTTSGYKVLIESISMEETDGIYKMTVHAKFTDPASGELLNQEITYPYCVAQTELDILPDEIELKVQYDE